MVISGLNKLGMQVASQAPKSAKPSTDASSSFGEVLGQASNVDSNFVPVQPGVPAGVGAGVVDPAVNPALPMPSVPMPKVETLISAEDSVDSLTRRVVWNDFLRKMKDELGVTAEDVLEAFASLSVEDLAKPPSESVDKVVMALGLSDQQAAIAKQYFQELINKTGSKSLGDEISASEKQISLTLMSQREMQRKTLQKSLEKMSNGFFLKNQPSVATPAALPAQKMEPAQDSGSNVKDAGFLAAPKLGGESLTSAASSASAAPMAPSASASAPAPVLPANMTPTAGTAPAVQQPVVKSETAKVDEMIRKFVSSQASSQMPKAIAADLSAPTAAASAGSAATTTSGATTAAAPTAAAFSAIQNILGADLSGSGDTTDEDAEFTSDAAYLGGLMNEGGTQSLNGPGQEFRTQLAATAPQQMSVPDIVQQAQVMVREGGGEMKVTLNQEGLGEVAMKVSVDQGKVNVQMITESDEAKKLIERQLSDLKSQLSHNNLQLDSIKIDTATNLGKQLEQQYQDAQRQQTQAFMEQFRQENQGWRQSFFETPAQRFYKGQGQASRDVQAPLDPNSRRASSRRLDLVA